MELEYPADETDMTSEQFDALAAGGEPVELVPPLRMSLTNGGGSIMGSVFIFNPTAEVAEPDGNRALAPIGGQTS